MRAVEDFLGRRIVIISGKYRCKKGYVCRASKFGIFVDLDYNALRILVQANEIRVLLDNGQLDKI